jgi:hypothetical protein
MQTALIILCLVVGPVLALVVVIMLPRWFPRRLHIHRMWRLRDEVIDEMLESSLPIKHPCVRRLASDVEGALHAKHLTMLDLYIFTWAFRGMDADVQRTMERHAAMPSSNGLTPEQKLSVERFRERFNVLLVGSVLTGSWFGLAHVALFIPRALVQLVRSLHGGVSLEDGVVASARTATDTAAKDTRLGQRIANLAESKREFLDGFESKSERELVGML